MLKRVSHILFMVMDRQGEYEVDEIVGYTKPSDVAVVTFININVRFSNKIPDGYYIELKMLTGEYAAYDGFALNDDDIKVASFVQRFLGK